MTEARASGPTADPLQPALAHRQAKAETAMASSGGFSARVVRAWPLECSHLAHFLQPRGSEHRCPGDPPAASRRPVRAGVRGTLRRRLVLKVGLLAGTAGMFG